MVSLLWSVIAASLGTLIFFAIPAVSFLASPPTRIKVGNFYYKMAMRSLQRAALIRRVLGGYSLLPLSVDNEQKTAQVTLASSLISDDKKLPFKDPDNRIKRLFSKPLAVNFEGVPAAIDAELSEIGHWTLEQHHRTGLSRGEEVSPYVRMGKSLRFSDPADLVPIAVKGAQPGFVETMKKITQERFAKYGGRVGVAEMAGAITGFLLGAGGYAALMYLRSNVLDETASGGPPIGVPPLGGGAIFPTDFLLDVAMILL